ncbi:hypothetical protein ACSVHA_18080 [Acinetobacter baumannii]
MKFLKFLTFSTILTLSAHSYATVGGGQKIEVNRTGFVGDFFI